MITKTKLELIKGVMQEKPKEEVEKLFNDYTKAFTEKKIHEYEEYTEYSRNSTMYVHYIEKLENKQKEAKKDGERKEV